MVHIQGYRDNIDKGHFSEKIAPGLGAFGLFKGFQALGFLGSAWNFRVWGLRL